MLVVVTLLGGCSCGPEGGPPPPSDATGVPPTTADTSTSPLTGDTAPSLGWVMLDTGFLVSCGVLTDGRIVCWGDDDRMANIPEGPFVEMSLSGEDITCGLRPDGTGRSTAGA